MAIAPRYFYSMAAICMATGAIGSAILAPFFMREKGFSIALAGIPLVVNGVGALCSDVISGTLASYFRSSFLLLAAVSIAIATCLFGYFFQDSLAIFLVAFSVLGLTEAMFSLAIRRIVFVQSSADQQGRAQGQVAAALGIGFALGPTFGGFVGEWWGADKLFLVYAVPQGLGLCLILLARGHRVEKPVPRGSTPLWQVGRRLLSGGAFFAACLAMFQSFLFLIGVTRIAFPFLAVRRGLALDVIGPIVSASRVSDTLGRLSGGWLCDRFGSRRVILWGVFLTVPAFALQVLGEGVSALVMPLCLMTAGFGLSNVGATTFALQAADDSSKGVALGLIRAATSIGRIAGPLLCGLLVESFGFQWAFLQMAFISLVIGSVSWLLFRIDREQG